MAICDGNMRECVVVSDPAVILISFLHLQLEETTRNTAKH